MMEIGKWRDPNYLCAVCLLATEPLALVRKTDIWATFEMTIVRLVDWLFSGGMTVVRLGLGVVRFAKANAGAQNGNGERGRVSLGHMRHVVEKRSLFTDLLSSPRVARTTNLRT
eukprot:scaffold9948_cov129-Cylindrotheca_fusiformis.AAC.2